MMNRPPLIQISLGILLFAILLSLTGTPTARAQPTSEYKGVDFCAGCHPAEVNGWKSSQHATAYTDSRFQQEWVKLGSPASCVSCHVTGFNATTGNYVYAGVTCEQCHGPGTTMRVNATAKFCASCHSGLFPTYSEWVRSGPGHANATCVFCHQQHTLVQRAGNVTATCGKCHGDIVEAVGGTAHGAAGLQCSVCHMYISAPEFVKGTPASTGHTFMMTPQQLNCTACHQRNLQKHNVLGIKSEACLVCHGDIHALNLMLYNSTVVPMSDPAPLCGECHTDRYTAWLRGTHGSQTQLYAPCTICHNPHNPIVDNIATLTPITPRVPAPPGNIDLLTALAVVVGILILVAVLMGGGRLG